MEDKVLENHTNPVEDFVNKTSEEIADGFSADEKFKEKVQDTIKSIINEKEVKTINEEAADIAKVVNDEVEAKKIRLAVKSWEEEHQEEVIKYKKEEFKRNFEEEIKKANPKITEDQLGKSREYADLVADNYFNNDGLNSQKNAALNENGQFFGPGAMQNGWTDLQGIFNFLNKKPKEIKEIKNKYNSLKDGLKDVNLPSKLRQVNSLENIMSGLNDPNSNKLFSRTKKYMGWADRIDKLTGGWLKKTMSRAGEKFISKIGNQFIKEFATNSLNVLAKEGFQKGFTTVLNGVLKGGVEKLATKVGSQVAVNVGEKVAANASQKAAMKIAARIATKVAVKAGAQSALLATATAFAAIPGIGWIVTAALLLIDAALWLKKKFGKLAEKLGISSKKFFEENFGKVGGKIVKALIFLVGLPAMLIGAASFAILAPVLIAVFAGISLFSIFQGGMISSLVPPKGVGSMSTTLIPAVPSGDPNVPGLPPGNGDQGCPDIWPVEFGYISQGSNSNSNFSHKAGKHAIDISGSNFTGRDIFATHAGIAKYYWNGSFADKGGGHCVMISGICNGVPFTSHYCHMIDRFLTAEIAVVKGTKIGDADNTGYSYGSHLHYQLKGLGIIDPYLPKPPIEGTNIP